MSITLKKSGESQPEVHTPKQDKVVENIRVVNGRVIAKELIGATCKSEKLEFSMEAQVTNPNYSQKKMKLILFVNRKFWNFEILFYMLKIDWWKISD